MKRNFILSFFFLLLLPGLVTAQIMPVLGSQRAGISALQFLKIGVGARAAGLGESFVAAANDASGLFWNPAGIVQFENTQFFVSHTEWVVDVRHGFGGAVFQLGNGSAVGVSVTALYTDRMKVTTETQPFGTGEYFAFGDIAIGVTYARKLTTQFSFGGTVKYVEETLAQLKMRTFMVDLGTYYWTGLGTSRFAVAVTNFGGEVQPAGDVILYDGTTANEWQSFSPPTVFRIGFAVEPYEDETHRVTTIAQLNHPNDNAENVGLGIEYAFDKTFFLRGGYRINQDEQRFSGGLGLAVPLSDMHTQFDYAYSNFEKLGGVHRISLTIGF
jgi:long-subunit fatty acid transport protein